MSFCSAGSINEQYTFISKKIQDDCKNLIDKIKQREEEILGMFEIYQCVRTYTSLRYRYKHWDTNIVELSGALRILSSGILTLNAQFEEGARDVINI